MHKMLTNFESTQLHRVMQPRWGGSLGLLTAINIRYVETRAYYPWWFTLSCILDACNHNKLNDNLSTTSQQCALIMFLASGSNGHSWSSKRQMLCYACILVVCAWQCNFGFKISFKKTSRIRWLSNILLSSFEKGWNTQQIIMDTMCCYIWSTLVGFSTTKKSTWWVHKYSTLGSKYPGVDLSLET